MKHHYFIFFVLFSPMFYSSNIHGMELEPTENSTFDMETFLIHSSKLTTYTKQKFDIEDYSLSDLKVLEKKNNTYLKTSEKYDKINLKAKENTLNQDKEDSFKEVENNRSSSIKYIVIAVGMFCCGTAATIYNLCKEEEDEFSFKKNWCSMLALLGSIPVGYHGWKKRDRYPTQLLEIIKENNQKLLAISVYPSQLKQVQNFQKSIESKINELEIKKLNESRPKRLPPSPPGSHREEKIKKVAEVLKGKVEEQKTPPPIPTSTPNFHRKKIPPPIPTSTPNFHRKNVTPPIPKTSPKALIPKKTPPVPKSFPKVVLKKRPLPSPPIPTAAPKKLSEKLRESVLKFEGRSTKSSPPPKDFSEVNLEKEIKKTPSTPTVKKKKKKKKSKRQKLIKSATSSLKRKKKK